MPAAAAAEHKGNKRSPMDTNNRDGHDGDKGSIGDGGPVGAVACASGNWMSSLRNANERLLQVGSGSRHPAESLGVHCCKVQQSAGPSMMCLNQVHVPEYACYDGCHSVHVPQQTAAVHQISTQHPLV